MQGKKALALIGAATAANAFGATRPNVVIIVADDLGWGDVSYHGSVIPTPNIDRLIGEGIELNRFYTAPVSSPTRCGLMTGRYPSRFGIRETVIPPWRDYGLPVEEETMADLLGRNGYTNRAAIGKWHMGHSRLCYYPLNRGFTHFHGALNGAFDYFDHTREKELDWHDDWESCHEEGYSTDLIAAEASRCIKEYAKGEPYLVYACFNAPHSPYQAPEEEIRKFISKEEFDALPPKDQKGWTYRNDGVDVYEKPNDTKSCGYYIGETKDGEWLQYTIENPNEAGKWQMQLRYAINSGSSTVRITVNDRAVTASTKL